MVRVHVRPFRLIGLPDYVQLDTGDNSVDVPLNPDGYFVLAIDTGRHDHFFLEVDRSSEPIARTTWRRTFVYRKLGDSDALSDSSAVELLAEPVWTTPIGASRVAGSSLCSQRISRSDPR